MIQSLIEGWQNIEAIKLIFEFELVGKFPPVPILENYYKYWKKTADEICERENNLTREQITIAKKSIAALKAVIRCIKDHMLETEHSTESIEIFIAVLRKKANSSYIVPADPMFQLEPQRMKKCDAPTDSIPKTQAKQKSRVKMDRRKAVSKDIPNARVRVPSTIHSIHAPPTGRGGRSLSSYPDRPVSFFAGNAKREPRYHMDHYRFLALWTHKGNLSITMNHHLLVALGVRLANLIFMMCWCPLVTLIYHLHSTNLSTLDENHSTGSH
ncbi:FRIGIDA-like protein 4a [Cornus florida]|uniref:FRIGIDA-like protein 4a n=1 Tax=Cornus florida TaxID=4283 RepID=UPI00289739B4|nr:FRIGIDA-like protein 4a [Cornus florida]